MFYVNNMHLLHLCERLWNEEIPVDAWTVSISTEFVLNSQNKAAPLELRMAIEDLKMDQTGTLIAGKRERWKSPCNSWMQITTMQWGQTCCRCSATLKHKVSRLCEKKFWLLSDWLVGKPSSVLIPALKLCWIFTCVCDKTNSDVRCVILRSSVHLQHLVRSLWLNWEALRIAQNNDVPKHLPVLSCPCCQETCIFKSLLFFCRGWGGRRVGRGRSLLLD